MNRRIALATIGALFLITAHPAMTCGAAEADPWSEALFLGAHRGGAGLWPENTATAFGEAAKRWPTILLEGDLRLTKDGHVILLHDATVDRTTDGTGPVSEMTLAEVKALDAGYRFSKDGGATFPWRGKGVTIPTLAEVLDAAPAHRFELELKDDPALIPAAVAIFKEKQAEERVIIASFKAELMAAFRKAAPAIATCYSTSSAMVLLTALRGENWDAYVPKDRMLSMPKRMLSQAQLTPTEVEKLKAKGIIVQLHTLNKAEEIAEARALGINSILTDNPELVKE